MFSITVSSWQGFNNSQLIENPTNEKLVNLSLKRSFKILKPLFALAVLSVSHYNPALTKLIAAL